MKHALYDDFAPYYADYAKKRQAYINAVDRLVTEAIKRLGRKVTILDVGAGNGVRSRRIARAVGAKQITLLEESGDMLASAGGRRDPLVQPLVGDICDPPRSLQTYDVVMALWNVFGHILPERRRRAAIRNMRDRLRPGGLLILDVSHGYNAAEYGIRTVLKNLLADLLPGAPERNHTYQLSMAPGQATTCTCHYFRTNELDRLLQDAGLTITRKAYYNYRTGKQERLPWRGQLAYVCTAG